MKVAVASMGTAMDAWVGIQFGLCSQFLVFDLDADLNDYIVVSLPPTSEAEERVSLSAIRAVASQGVSVVITGHIKDICRQTLLNLGIEVIDGVEGMSVREAVERYKATGLATPESRKGTPVRLAVVAQEEGLDAPVEMPFGLCTSFTMVDPLTMEWSRVEVAPDGPTSKVHFHSIQTVVRNGASVLLTPQITPECCIALQALAVEVYLVPAGITVREAVARYERGELKRVLT